MPSLLTGHAEIDRQHAFLEELAGRVGDICEKRNGSPEADCIECPKTLRSECGARLSGLIDQLFSFLVGHVTYEEKLMELLPDIERCRLHIEAHKRGHSHISEQLGAIATQIGEEDPQRLGSQLHDVIKTWLGPHATEYDAYLSAELEKSSASELDFDAALVSILDELVFLNRPAKPSAVELSRQVLAAQGLGAGQQIQLLTAKQREVCLLMVKGLSNKEIAKRLGVSINTVKTHRTEIFRRLKVNSLLDLVRRLDR